MLWLLTEAGVGIGDVPLDGNCGLDVRLATGVVAFATLGKTASIHRLGVLGVDAQHSGVVFDCLVKSAQPVVREAPVVHHTRIAGQNL